jgi:hypothetical protein
MQGLCLGKCLVCPVPKDEPHVKLIFNEEQVKNEGTLISHLNMYLEIQKGLLCLGFLFKV